MKSRNYVESETEERGNKVFGNFTFESTRLESSVRVMFSDVVMSVYVDLMGSGKHKPSGLEDDLIVT